MLAFPLFCIIGLFSFSRSHAPTHRQLSPHGRFSTRLKQLCSGARQTLEYPGAACIHATGKEARKESTTIYHDVQTLPGGAPCLRSKHKENIESTHHLACENHDWFEENYKEPTPYQQRGII